MHVHALHSLAAAGLDPNQSVAAFRALAIGVLSLILLVISISAALSAGRRGNTAKAANITLATVLCLIPGAIAVGIGALAFGAAFLGWAVPGLSQ